MHVLTDKIISIIGDYENNLMTSEHIIGWVEQFDEKDRNFILEELSIVFEKTYVSKAKCFDLITRYINYWTTKFNYKTVQEFLRDTVFLDLQAPQKSQKELLAFLDSIIHKAYGIKLNQCGQNALHYIYLDDILSTGGTIVRQLKDWLNAVNTFDNSKSNYAFIKSTGITLHVCLFCCHSWGRDNVEFQLMKAFDNDIKKHIEFAYSYLIENSLKSYNPKLNHMLPVTEQPTEVHDYLASLQHANRYENWAFRKIIQPVNETLFSSSASRIRLENIFLKKGIDILTKVQQLKPQHRPLGYTIKSHKTFGLGTLFFTYRNIPNNSPIVFWWDNPKHDWKPLFVVKNRGITA